MAKPGSTDKTKLNRLSYKSSSEVSDLESILDANLVAHVAVVFDGDPLVIPMAYGRVGNTLFLHGSSGSRLMRVLEKEPRVCISITELNGIKVARSTFNSGMHYRSVVIFGNAKLVPAEQKAAALDAISNSMIPGRVAEVRASNKKELAATLIISVELDETSVKISDNPVSDEPEDFGTGVWAGIVPMRQVVLEAIAADEESAGLEIPKSVLDLKTKYSGID
jgi:uncharacterized protein